MAPAKRKQNAKKPQIKVDITKTIFLKTFFLVRNDCIVFIKEKIAKIKNKLPKTNICQTSISLNTYLKIDCKNPSER